MGLGVSLGVGLGGDVATSVASPNPNLLLWTEQMQQAIWVATLVAVNADAATHPVGGATADILTFTAGGSIVQSSGIAATTGAPVSLGFAPDATWTRRSITGTFDGTVYYLSVETRDLSEAGLNVSLRMFLSGGFLAAGFVDIAEEAPVFECWGWKLETPTLTAYVKREGT